MNAREIAHRTLVRIYQEKAYSHLVLQHALEELETQDKALVTQIVYGTIQNFMLVRHLWERHVASPVKKTALAVLLDMSIYQLRFLDKVPSYAVVHEAVEIAKRYGQANASFVNGVLQAYLRSDQAIDPQITDPLEKLALTTSHPLWLIKMWVKHYGYEAAEAIAGIDNEPPRHCARVNTLKTTKEAIIKEYGCQSGHLSEDAVYFDEPITSTRAFACGEVAIQDEASQLVAITVDPKQGERILDVCAAPGSKTIHMAARMNNQGEIIAQELHEHRAELIRQNCARYGVTIVDVRTADSTKSASLHQPQSFDRVLVDAPCSGFGVLRRKPDIKMLSRQDDLDGILAIQKELLHSAADLVKPGGVLVYSTCTLNKKENEKQVEAFLAANSDYALDMQRTILPYEYDCDGFYIARMVRKPI